jgi:hypothetical protein
VARAVAIALGVVALALAVMGAVRYPGSPVVYAFFTLSMFTFVGLAFPAPRLYVYSFVAIFLGMGLWAKTMVHTIWAPSFLEPTGDFGNSPREWDQALLAMAAAVLGVAAVRAAHLCLRRRRAARPYAAADAPAWFTSHRRALWLATFVAVAAVNAANLAFAFYQIGVNPKWLLPLRLHVLLAWLVNIGFALWIAALLWWDYRAHPTTLLRNIVIAFLEALASSVSAFSRILYLVHAVPYGLALLEERKRLAGAARRATLVIVAACFVACFVASLAAVFVLRASYYPSNADLARNVKLEIPQLIVRRWIGLEGVLAVGAVPGRNASLLAAALVESPKTGAASLYQRIARNRYQLDETHTFLFLTNAGPVAVLWFSGSLLVVGLGMAIGMALLVATEELAAAWTGNPFLLALAGAALANVVCQTTYFYLTLIFTAQMWLALALIAVLSRARA